MKTLSLHKLSKQLSKALDKSRYEHTLGVSYTAAALAMRYREDIEKAQLAGMLHDCAKCLDNSKKIRICEKNNIEITEAERSNPFLLHAKAGACLAAKKYGVEDEDVLNAITYHTTGRPGMSMLEKIIYIADYIEPGRNQEPDLQELRALAFQDIDKALLEILQHTLLYLSASQKEIDPMTQKTYDYYQGMETI
jgi:predicted HD superfamily hydrolase involved in NAD metabolism